MKPITILTAAIAPLPHEEAMARAIRALEPERSVQLALGHAASIIGTCNYCPMTLDVAAGEPAMFALCRDVAALRTQVQQQWSMESCDRGDLWLPVIWTAKGPLYAEVIQDQAGQYQQPFHLRDPQRQPLYRFAYQLLSHYDATPAVYCLAFQWQGERLAFDRLLPFPGESAIASVGVQEPDLFTCHWLCVTEQPILDVQIRSVSVSA